MAKTKSVVTAPKPKVVEKTLKDAKGRDYTVKEKIIKGDDGKDYVVQQHTVVSQVKEHPDGWKYVGAGNQEYIKAWMDWMMKLDATKKAKLGSKMPLDPARIKTWMAEVKERDILGYKGHGIVKEVNHPGGSLLVEYELGEERVVFGWELDMHLDMGWCQILYRPDAEGNLKPYNTPLTKEHVVNVVVGEAPKKTSSKPNNNKKKK